MAHVAPAAISDPALPAFVPESASGGSPGALAATVFGGVGVAVLALAALGGGARKGQRAPGSARTPREGGVAAGARPRPRKATALAGAEAGGRVPPRVVAPVPTRARAAKVAPFR